MQPSRPDSRRDDSPSPASAEELAIIAIDLLVKEVGIESAQNLMSQAILRYSTEAPSSA